MDLGIKDKVALVTASSRGLGKSIAKRLAQEGSIVAICSRNEERIFKARDEIKEETGQRVKAFITDVREKAQILKMVREIVDELEKIDILVTNSGGPPSGLFDEFETEDYREALELNLLSTVNLCYAVIPSMMNNRWGRIIMMTSVAAKQPIDNLILSNTARSGVLGFMKSLSNQLAPHGITVNSVCPGYILTERVEELAKAYEKKGKGTVEDFYRGVEKSIPCARLGRPEEIAMAVAFLASECAAYITGVALQVDGGFIKGIF